MYRNRSKVIKLDAWERAEMRLSLTVLFRRRLERLAESQWIVRAQLIPRCLRRGACLLTPIQILVDTSMLSISRVLPSHAAPSTTIFSSPSRAGTSVSRCCTAM